MEVLLQGRGSLRVHPVRRLQLHLGDRRGGLAQGRQARLLRSQVLRRVQHGRQEDHLPRREEPRSRRPQRPGDNAGGVHPGGGEARQAQGPLRRQAPALLQDDMLLQGHRVRRHAEDGRRRHPGVSREGEGLVHVHREAHRLGQEDRRGVRRDLLHHHADHGDPLNAEDNLDRQGRGGEDYHDLVPVHDDGQGGQEGAGVRHRPQHEPGDDAGAAVPGRPHDHGEQGLHKRGARRVRRRRRRLQGDPREVLPRQQRRDPRDGHGRHPRRGERMPVLGDLDHQDGAGIRRPGVVPREVRRSLRGLPGRAGDPRQRTGQGLRLQPDHDGADPQVRGGLQAGRGAVEEPRY